MDTIGHNVNTKTQELEKSFTFVHSPFTLNIAPYRNQQSFM
jgi:hypothetical protein